MIIQTLRTTNSKDYSQEYMEKDAYFLRAKRIEIPSSITDCEFYKKMGYTYKNGIGVIDEEQLFRLEKSDKYKWRSSYMEVRKFQLNHDLQNLEAYLRDRYLENRNMTSWLPERLHDLIYRMGAQETDGGRKKSADYIFLWEENGEIVACILPDGENIYVSIKTGFEHLYPSVLAYSEQNCLPLFHKAEDGSVKFWVVANDSLTYMQEILLNSGYTRYAEEDYDNYVYPLEMCVSVELPKGFRLLYGEEYDDEQNKWSACSLGFHPDLEASDYRTGMNPYHSRKNSSMYRDSFECIVVDENAGEGNDVCSYCFVYVDEASKTAYIEPVSTREKYRRKGIGTAMMHGVMLRCKEKGIEKCYVNSYDWRRKFYNAAGFVTEDRIGFWHKTISCNG